MPPNNCNSTLQLSLNQIYFHLKELSASSGGGGTVDLSAVLTALNDLDHQMSNFNIDRTSQISAAENNLLTAIENIGTTGGTVDLSAVMAALTDIQANTPTDLSAVITLLDTINAKPSGQATDLTAVMAALTDIQANTPTDLSAVITLLNEINAKPSGQATDLTAVMAALTDIQANTPTDLSAVMAALTDIQANTPTDLSAVITLLNEINAKPSGGGTVDLTAVMAALTDIQANTPTDLTALQSTADTINANTSGLSAQITPIGANLTALQTTVNGHTTQLTNLQTSINAITSTSDLAAQIANLTSKVTQIYDNLYPPPVLELKFNQNTFTDLLGTVPAGANDYVRSWRSTVGGHLFTQAMDAARPQRQSDGLYFDGGDGMDLVFALKTLSPWCYEEWRYDGNITGNSALFCTTPLNLYLFWIASSIYIGQVGINIIVQPTMRPLQTWYHVAASFDGTTYRIFVNGMLVANTTNLLPSITSTNIHISYLPVHGYFHLGKKTDIRLYDIAKYTANFTPPTRSV